RSGSVLAAPPLVVGVHGTLHDLVELSWVGDQRRLCRARVGLWGEQGAGPLAVLRQRWVGVRLVGEVARDGTAGGADLVPGLLDAVLGAARAVVGVPALGDGLTEAVLLAFHRRQAGVVVLLRGKQRGEGVRR